MMAAARRAAGALVALAATLAVAALSRAPYRIGRPDQAILRLAWRTRGERVRECRRATPVELERLPAHMRQAEVCEGRLRPFRLEVRLDGAPAMNEEIRPAGARHDRPLYVFREMAVAPGPHRVYVRFSPLGPAPQRAPGDTGTGYSEPGAVTIPALELDSAVTVAAPSILLITYDPEVQRLVIRRGEEAARPGARRRVD